MESNNDKIFNESSNLREKNFNSNYNRNDDSYYDDENGGDSLSHGDDIIQDEFFLQVEPNQHLNHLKVIKGTSSGSGNGNGQEWTNNQQSSNNNKDQSSLLADSKHGSKRYTSINNSNYQQLKQMKQQQLANDPIILKSHQLKQEFDEQTNIGKMDYLAKGNDQLYCNLLNQLQIQRSTKQTLLQQLQATLQTITQNSKLDPNQSFVNQQNTCLHINQTFTKINSSITSALVLPAATQQQSSSTLSFMYQRESDDGQRRLQQILQQKKETQNQIEDQTLIEQGTDANLNEEITNLKRTCEMIKGDIRQINKLNTNLDLQLNQMNENILKHGMDTARFTSDITLLQHFLDADRQLKDNIVAQKKSEMINHQIEIKEDTIKLNLIEQEKSSIEQVKERQLQDISDLDARLAKKMRFNEEREHLINSIEEFNMVVDMFIVNDPAVFQSQMQHLVFEQTRLKKQMSQSSLESWHLLKKSSSKSPTSQLTKEENIPGRVDADANLAKGSKLNYSQAQRHEGQTQQQQLQQNQSELYKKIIQLYSNHEGKFLDVVEKVLQLHRQYAMIQETLNNRITDLNQQKGNLTDINNNLEKQIAEIQSQLSPRSLSQQQQKKLQSINNNEGGEVEQNDLKQADDIDDDNFRYISIENKQMVFLSQALDDQIYTQKEAELINIQRQEQFLGKSFLFLNECILRLAKSLQCTRNITEQVYQFGTMDQEANASSINCPYFAKEPFLSLDAVHSYALKAKVYMSQQDLDKSGLVLQESLFNQRNMQILQIIQQVFTGQPIQLVKKLGDSFMYISKDELFISYFCLREQYQNFFNKIKSDIIELGTKNTEIVGQIIKDNINYLREEAQLNFRAIIKKLFTHCESIILGVKQRKIEIKEFFQRLNFNSYVQHQQQLALHKQNMGQSTQGLSQSQTQGRTLMEGETVDWKQKVVQKKIQDYQQLQNNFRFEEGIAESIEKNLSAKLTQDLNVHDEELLYLFSKNQDQKKLSKLPSTGMGQPQLKRGLVDNSTALASSSSISDRFLQDWNFIIKQKQRYQQAVQEIDKQNHLAQLQKIKMNSLKSCQSMDRNINNEQVGANKQFNMLQLPLASTFHSLKQMKDSQISQAKRNSLNQGKEELLSPTVNNRSIIFDAIAARTNSINDYATHNTISSNRQIDFPQNQLKGTITLIKRRQNGSLGDDLHLQNSNNSQSNHKDNINSHVLAKTDRENTSKKIEQRSRSQINKNPSPPNLSPKNNQSGERKVHFPQTSSNANTMSRTSYSPSLLNFPKLNKGLNNNKNNQAALNSNAGQSKTISKRTSCYEAEHSTQLGKQLLRSSSDQNLKPLKNANLKKRVQLDFNFSDRNASLPQLNPEVSIQPLSSLIGDAFLQQKSIINFGFSNLLTTGPMSQISMRNPAFYKLNNYDQELDLDKQFFFSANHDNKQNEPAKSQAKDFNSNQEETPSANQSPTRENTFRQTPSSNGDFKYQPVVATNQFQEQ